MCGWSQHKIDCWFTDISRGRRLNKQQPLYLSQVVVRCTVEHHDISRSNKMSFLFKEANFCRYRSTTRFFLCARTKLVISNSYRYCCLDSDSAIWNVNNLEELEFTPVAFGHFICYQKGFATHTLLTHSHTWCAHLTRTLTNSSTTTTSSSWHHHDHPNYFTLLTDSLIHWDSLTRSLTHLARSHNTH